MPSLNIHLTLAVLTTALNAFTLQSTYLFSYLLLDIQHPIYYILDAWINDIKNVFVLDINKLTCTVQPDSRDTRMVGTGDLRPQRKATFHSRSVMRG